jgi:hypothetical protein
MLVSILILVLAVLIAIESCATSKKAYVAKEDEELYGTWVNPEYDRGKPNAKIVIKPDGTLDAYSLSNSERPIGVSEYTITDKWTDSEGNIWYKIVETFFDQKVMQNPDTYYSLSKIDKTGNTLEELWSSIDYPPKFELDNLRYSYYIRYRQE